MASPTLTETLDNLYTTTWQNMKGEVADNIMDATPLWYWLRANGGLEAVEGGRFLTEPLRYALSDNVAFVQKGTAMPLADKDFLTTSWDNWRYLADSLVRFGVDDQQNRGKNQIISLMNAKLENSKDSLVDKMEETLAGAQSGIAFNGLQDLVAEDPTNTVQNISGTTYTWWQNQYQDATGRSTTALLVDDMNRMVNLCSQNQRQDAPNIILSGQTPYEEYWSETVEQRRVMNKTLGDAGFQNIEFRGIPMVWSPDVADNTAIGSGSGTMYFLNTRFLKFKYDPMMFFDMTEWKPIPAQINDRAAQVVLAGNLMTSRRRVHGVYFNIDTA
jgi:hypothetical protein